MIRGKHKKDGRKKDMPWNWSTPSWFTKLYMNDPVKRKFKDWEGKVKRTSLEDIAEHEYPIEPDKKGRQEYFW